MGVIFGRKEPGGPSALRTFDAFEAFVRQNDPSHMGVIPVSWIPAVLANFAKLDPSRKADILCALAAGSYLDTRGSWNSSRPEERLGACANSFLWQTDMWKEFERSPRVFAALAGILGVASPLDWQFRKEAPWFDHMVGIAEAGHVPSEAERAHLLCYRARLQKQGHRESWQKHRDKERVIAWIDGLLGTAETDESKLSRLSPAQAEGETFPPLPANAAFWTDLLCEASARLATLVDEARARKAPAWMLDENLYREQFPPFADDKPAFGFWNGDNGPFAQLKWDWQNGARLATPAMYRACAEAPRTLAAITTRWRGAEVPGVALLADVSSPDEQALLLHLAGTADGIRPTARWIKEARRLAEPIGWADVGYRLVEWLNQFANVIPTYEAIGTAHNYWTLVAACETLEQLRPDLPGTADPAELERAAASLAMSGLWSRWNFGFLWIPFSNEYWRGVLGKPHSSEGKDRRHEPTAEKLVPSLSNEALLRGVCWLLGEFDGPEFVDVLERTAVSAMAFSTGDGARSRVTANAAIAALARIGTADALVALGRVRRSIKNKAIANAVAKAIDGLAAKLGVAPDDVEEMGVPSYGFA